MKNFYEKGLSYAVRRTYLKGILLAIFLLGMGSEKMNAQVWTISVCSGMPGQTQSNLYGPMYSVSGANATNRLATIYPASQLTGIANQVLTGVYFHTKDGNANGMLGTPSYKIWLKEVTQDNWGSGSLDWATASAGATLLFDGNPVSNVGTGGGWKEFPFTGTFTYSGTQNLALFVEYTNPNASNAITWSYEYNLSGTCTSANGTKYSNNTTGTLPASLSSSEMRRPYIAFDMVVSCPAPLNINVSGVTQTNVSATWTAGGTETSWDYALQPAGTGIPTSWTSISTPSFSSTTLTPNTQYEFFVRANCGAVDGASVWKGPYNFLTLCGPATSMFENFDSYTAGAFLPSCWVRLMPPSGTAGTLSINSTAPASGLRNVYQFTSAANVSGIAVLPEFSNVNAGTHWLRFKARTSSTALPGALEVGFVTDVADWNSFVNLQTLDIVNGTYNDNYYTVVIPNWIPATARLAIKNPSDGKGYYWDDVYWEQMPTCLPPTNFAYSNITPATADITWTAPSTAVLNYSVYYSTSNTSPDATTVPSHTVTGTSVSLSTLNPGTNYFVWVRANCSATDQSAWVQLPVLMTQCAPMTYLYENFDSNATGSVVPNCWDRIISGTGSQTISTTTPFSAPNNIYQYSSTAANSTIVVLPEFSNINAGTHWLRFKARATSVVAATALEVGYVTDATSASSFVLLQTVPILETSYGLDYKIQVPTSVPANARLAIRNPGATTASYYWDDVYWEPTPSCLPPTNVAITGVTAYGAQVTWTAPTTPVGTGYDVYIDTTNTAPTAATVPTVSSATSPATLQNLTPATTYYVWVRSNCGSGDLSDWIQVPVSFLTSCAPVATLFEDFDSYATGAFLPSCWVRLMPTTGTAGTLSINSTSPASGTRNVYQYTSAANVSGIAVLPEFSNVNAGTHWLRFKARTSSTALPGALEVGYVTDATDWNSFVNLQTLDIVNGTYNDNYYTVVIPNWIPATARLAIKNPSDAKGYYWDDVHWEMVPTCFAPTNPVLTAASFTSLDFSWTAPVGSPTPVQGYEYYISTSNTPPTSATVPSGTSATTSASITTNLLPETLYYIWVRSVCSTTDRSDWSGVLQATTGYCVPTVGTSTTYYLATMNTTGATTDLNYTASSYSPYVNNSATSVINAYPTQSFDIFLDGSGTSTYYYYVWVDWNNNMSFEDAGELIIAPTSTTYIASLSETLTIPAGTPYGSYRVRVGMSFSGVIDSSCGSGRSGNFVDLTLNVGAPPTCVEPSNIQVSNVTHNSATIGWDASVTPPAMGYDIYYSATNTPPTATSVPQVQNAPGLSADITGLAPITTYYVWVRSHCSGTDQSFWTSVPVTVATLCQPPAITGTTSSTSATPMCMNDTATLTATADAGANITWYDAPTGGNEVGTGATFTTPALAASTNYYAAASFGGTQSAALANATSTSGYTQEAGLFFDASASFVLEGVYVYPIGTGSGDVVIALQDGSVSPAVTLQTVTVTLTGSGAPYVKTFVPLNFNIVPGTNYKLMMMSRSGGVASLVRESGSAWGTYPLTIPSVLSITNGNCCSGNTTSASYYYFYDWQISTKCEGARVPVAVDVNTGCSLSTSEITKDDRSIMVYPNPFTDVINISDARNLKSVTVMDASGRMVKTIANPGSQIHLGELKSGLYLLKLGYADGNTKTVKVIKR